MRCWVSYKIFVAPCEKIKSGKWKGRKVCFLRDKVYCDSNRANDVDFWKINGNRTCVKSNKWHFEHNASNGRLTTPEQHKGKQRTRPHTKKIDEKHPKAFCWPTRVNVCSDVCAGRPDPVRWEHYPSGSAELAANTQNLRTIFLANRSSTQKIHSLLGAFQLLETHLFISASLFLCSIDLPEVPFNLKTQCPVIFICSSDRNSSEHSWPETDILWSNFFESHLDAPFTTLWLLLCGNSAVNSPGKGIPCPQWFQNKYGKTKLTELSGRGWSLKVSCRLWNRHQGLDGVQGWNNPKWGPASAEELQEPRPIHGVPRENLMMTGAYQGNWDFHTDDAASKFWRQARNRLDCLVICAGTSRARSTIGSLFQKYVYSTFSMNMVLNCVHIWSVDLLRIRCQKEILLECSNKKLALCQLVLSGTVDWCKSRKAGGPIYFRRSPFGCHVIFDAHASTFWRTPQQFWCRPACVKTLIPSCLAVEPTMALSGDFCLELERTPQHWVQTWPTWVLPWGWVTKILPFVNLTTETKTILRVSPLCTI